MESISCIKQSITLYKGRDETLCRKLGLFTYTGFKSGKTEAKVQKCVVETIEIMRAIFEMYTKSQTTAKYDYNGILQDTFKKIYKGDQDFYLDKAKFLEAMKGKGLPKDHEKLEKLYKKCLVPKNSEIPKSLEDEKKIGGSNENSDDEKTIGSPKKKKKTKEYKEPKENPKIKKKEPKVIKEKSSSSENSEEEP